MTAADATARRGRRWRAAAGTAVLVVIVALLAVVVGRKVLHAAAGPDASAPSCSWSAHIDYANSDQAGLIRCYLSALAHHSSSEMRSVVPATGNNGPTGFSASDFVHGADARSGSATVTVAGSDVDSADASLSIRFADRAREEHEIHLADPGSSRSWRFVDVGTYPADPNAPPPVAPPDQPAAGS